MADFPSATEVIQITMSKAGIFHGVLESGLPLAPGMALREFLDSKGVSWRVWSTIPSAASRLGGGFGEGWLTFERTSRPNPATAFPLRRLVPIPPDWEEASENRLDLLCRAAEEVTLLQVRARGVSSESTESR